MYRQYATDFDVCQEEISCLIGNWTAKRTHFQIRFGNLQFLSEIFATKRQFFIPIKTHFPCNTAPVQQTFLHIFRSFFSPIHHEFHIL